MIKYPKIQMLPIIILWGFLVYLIITVMTTDISLREKQYAGITSISISTILYFFKIKYGHIFTGITLFVGTFSLLAFTPIIRTFGFGIGSLNIHFDDYCPAIFILYIFLHQKNIPVWLGDFFKNS
jgi:hypothetical protein